MGKIKTLFPPSVPSSLPAFDKNENLKYYFKPSIANTMSQVESLQISIVRLDTNRNELDEVKYPYGLMFLPKSAAQLDERTGYYYIVLDKSIFKSSDTAYKIQIRFSEIALPSDIMSDKMGEWLKENLDKFSEWSIVTIAMPITIPDFGITNLIEGQDNKLDSSAYNFVGYYQPKDPNRQEILTFYKFNIYTYDDIKDTSSWKLYATSGDKTVGIYEKPSLSHVFNKDLLPDAKYVVTFSIKSKNLYTKTRIYPVTTAYPALEMFNTINTIADENNALVEVTVNAKQIIMKPVGNSKVTYLKEEPGHESYPDLRATHAVIEGAIYENEKFFMINQEAKNVIQTRVRAMYVHESIESGSKTPTIELKYNAKGYDDYSYYSTLKLFAIRINTAYPTSNNLNPEPVWDYKFVLRKEVLSKSGNKETVIFSQNKILRTNEPIVPQQEYYFFIKENQGLIDFTMSKTYKAR